MANVSDKCGDKSATASKVTCPGCSADCSFAPCQMKGAGARATGVFQVFPRIPPRVWQFFNWVVTFSNFQNRKWKMGRIWKVNAFLEGPIVNFHDYGRKGIRFPHTLPLQKKKIYIFSKMMVSRLLSFWDGSLFTRHLHHHRSTRWCFKKIINKVLPTKVNGKHTH